MAECLLSLGSGQPPPGAHGGIRHPRGRRAEFLVGGITLGYLDGWPFRHQAKRPIKVTLTRAEDAEKPFVLEVEILPLAPLGPNVRLDLYYANLSRAKLIGQTSRTRLFQVVASTESPPGTQSCRGSSNLT